MIADTEKSRNPMQALPFYMDYCDQDQIPALWHPETKLYFLLTGSAKIIVRGQTFQMQPEDIFLINPGETCQISGSVWKAAVLSFRQDLLPRLLPGQTTRFELCSAGNTYATRYDYPRYCFSQLASLQDRPDQAFSSLSIFFALYSNLLTNFAAGPSQDPNSTEQSNERLLAIINYINDHYRDNLTLNETASRFGLSVPYFSAFFKKQAGRTFIEYYNEIRLSHAVNDLLFSGDSIESIAVRNGFADPRSFTALFKKQYGILPNAYRKTHRTTLKEQSLHQQHIGKDENSIPKKGSASDRISAFSSLSKYATLFREEAEYVTLLSENPRLIDAGTVSLQAEGKTLANHYRNMICVGSARQFLYKEVQDMLVRVQNEIGFRYVKFHGLLSDEMMVYSEDSKGNPHYSFTLLDKILDFLLSINLRPLCQLSFMPIALAEDPSRLVDFYHYNTSPPKDIRKWTNLVIETVRHFISRYGLEEVKTWLFCVWNEPDETVEQFAWNDRNRFFDFYVRTWKAIKNICPDLQVGTPSLLLSVQKESGWAGDFFIYCHNQGCYPDFLNIHYYDNSLFEEDATDRVRGEKGFSAENMERFFPLTADPFAFRKFINNVKGLMRKHNMRSLPIYLTEWNLTISHRDLINDTCFKACHLVKNLLENYDRLASYSYWCLTDFIEELQLAETLYHGGLGLFTYNGIPKANYNAFLLLRMMEDELLAKGEGYFITRSENRICIMLYNYEHYSKLFAAGQRTEQNLIDRYSPFEEMSTAQFSVRLSDLPCSSILVKEFFVNQYAGSSYDTWARMGSIPLEQSKDYELLLQESRPGLRIHKETVESGLLQVHIRMAPLEVRLIEMEFINHP